MSKIDHYMVDYLDNGGAVRFANDTPIHSLTAAKAMASKLSRSCDTGAYVVAWAPAPGSSPGSFISGQYVAVGHISFFDGKQSSTDGVVI